MLKLSLKHLEEVQESYLAHGLFAIKQGVIIISIGCASIIHGLIPGFFKFYAPDKILEMAEMVRKRHSDRVDKDCE